MEDDAISMDEGINFLARRQTVVEEPPKKQMSLRDRIMASINKNK